MVTLLEKGRRPIVHGSIHVIEEEGKKVERNRKKSVARKVTKGVQVLPFFFFFFHLEKLSTTITSILFYSMLRTLYFEYTFYTVLHEFV